MSRIVAVGDSHLQRLRGRRRELDCPVHPGRTVDTVAKGGSRTVDLADQIARAEIAPGDRVLVSVGTNDAASWHPLPLDEANDLWAKALALLKESGADRVVLVTTPGVDRARLPRSNDSTESDLREHARSYAEVARQRGAVVVNAAEVLAEMGPSAFCEDGLHLSDEGYDRLIPVLAEALCGCVSSSPP
jgi:lysophospholipase L1-like esterase